MKISIVTCCKNAEKLIAETIESVINQVGEFEIDYVIIDGASTDRTFQIIEDYANRVNNGHVKLGCGELKIRYLTEKDRGLYDGLLKGFNLANGEIIAYLNAGDFYLPNALSTVIDIFKSFPDVKWLTGFNVAYNEKGQIISVFKPYKYVRKWILSGVYGYFLPFIQQESTFWRRELLSFPEIVKIKNYKLAGDYFLWYNFAKKEKLYVAYSAFGGFRIHHGQLSEKIYDYIREMKLINNNRRVWPWSYFVIFLHNLICYLPDRLKWMIDDTIIRYDTNKRKWVKGGILLRRKVEDIK